MLEQFVPQQVVGARIIDETEATRIVEPHFDPVLEDHERVIVPLRRRRLRRVAQCQPSRHAEMHDQHAAIIEAQQDVFRAPVDAIDPSSFNLGRQVLGNRPP